MPLPLNYMKRSQHTRLCTHNTTHTPKLDYAYLTLTHPQSQERATTATAVSVCCLLCTPHLATSHVIIESLCQHTPLNVCPQTA